VCFSNCHIWNENLPRHSRLPKREVDSITGSHHTLMSGSDDELDVLELDNKQDVPGSLITQLIDEVPAGSYHPSLGFLLKRFPLVQLANGWLQI
jgi:hypothetical protein